MKPKLSRLEKNIADLGRIGWVDGEGLQRESYSPAFFQARDWLASKFEEIGLRSRVDKVGNLFACLKGDSGRRILTGSHLDSVKNGGIYDGALGILAALEALTVLLENGYVPRNTLEIVAFVAEEGGPLDGVFGSRAFAGLIGPDYKPEELEKVHLSSEDILLSRGEIDQYDAFLELHIEQGPWLELQEVPIGIPNTIVAISRYQLVFNGVANHAGTTPMTMRSDALRKAIHFVNKWYEWADRQENLVYNIGKLVLKPGYASVIPSQVELCLEIRSPNEEVIQIAQDEISFAVQAESDSAFCVIGNKGSAKLNEKVTQIVESVCLEEKIPHCYMASGASHDANPISMVIPTGMIFVPSKEGVSHSKDEYTEPQDLLIGADVLLKTLIQLDQA